MTRIYTLAFILLLSITSMASDTLFVQNISRILESIPASSKYGVMIFNPAKEETLFVKDIQLPVVPASNVKLFTTGVALSMLGGDYKLSTRVFCDDINTSDGIINGNVYIKGFGNSMFTDSDMDSLAAALYRLGIRKITGSVIGDDSYFDSVYHRKDWIIEELSSVPLPPVSAMVINRNRLTLNINATGGSVRSSMYPDCSLIDVVVNVSKSRKRNSTLRVSQVCDGDEYKFIVSGSLGRRGSSRSYSFEIDNPPLFAAYLLQDRLNRLGISVGKHPKAGIMPETVTYLLSERSIALKNLIRVINKNSDNFLAECLFKTIGAVYSESQGNAFYATQAVLTFLKSNGIYSEGTALVDGSGISHFNQVTVAAVVDLLDKVYYDHLIFNDYYSSLSVAGVDGTLRGRLYGTHAQNNLHGKTGTLHGVTALSGYVKSKSGDDLIVSMIFEYKSGYVGLYKSVQDRIIKELTE
ncbi:MAG: D-alanyl-D-alanine carboxypeptidase/D-alanyl-D-alanine-endopeptidase [Bacteroidota bacterium]